MTQDQDQDTVTMEEAMKQYVPTLVEVIMADSHMEPIVKREGKARVEATLYVYMYKFIGNKIVELDDEIQRYKKAKRQGRR